METVSVDVNAILAERRKKARRKLFWGPLLLLVALGGLANVWAEQHTLFIYSAVWPLGTGILGVAFLRDARYALRTNHEPKGCFPLFGQLVVCAGRVGPLFTKWTRSHDPLWLWAFLFPLLLAAAGLILFGFRFAVKAVPAWFGSLFPRQR